MGGAGGAGGGSTSLSLESPDSAQISIDGKASIQLVLKVRRGARPTEVSARNGMKKGRALPPYLLLQAARPCSVKGLASSPRKVQPRVTNRLQIVSGAVSQQTTALQDVSHCCNASNVAPDVAFLQPLAAKAAQLPTVGDAASGAHWRGGGSGAAAAAAPCVRVAASHAMATGARIDQERSSLPLPAPATQIGCAPALCWCQPPASDRGARRSE